MFFRWNHDAESGAPMTAWPGLLAAFSDHLPIGPNTPKLTLLEGNTPLLFAPKISELINAQVFLKFEGLNPTGSFKDRGMVVAVAKAAEEKKEAVICASTGNTSASAAAYAARAGLRCFVVIPSGKVALGKLSQALMYGATVIPILENFDKALTAVREFAKNNSIALVNSVNPYRIEGQKTAAFEICQSLGAAPNYLSLPVGNAGNITAYWKGFKEYNQSRKTGLPKMLGFQAEGAAPIVSGRAVENPQTIATAIRIGNPASWEGAKAALAESKGRILAISDQRILNAYRLLAKEEGVFAEPASAISVAGIWALSDEQKFQPSEKIVCVLTGNGLKDPDTALSLFKNQSLEPIPVERVEEMILGQKSRR